MSLKSTIAAVLEFATPAEFLRALTLLAIIVISATQLCEAASTDMNDDAMAALQRGEILLQIIHTEKSGGAARVTALFHSSAEAVWDIIGYCRYKFIYMRGLELCEMLGGDQFQMTMHHRLRNSWYTPTLDYTFEAHREPGGNGQARLIEGDLKVLEGQWRLFPLTDDNSVIVVHEIRIQPKIPAPKWLVRRSLRNDLPDMLACIRGLARASGDNGHIESDLERCPGEVPAGFK
jgi:hypothetical protein